jgi:hypothetical protein
MVLDFQKILTKIANQIIETIRSNSDKGIDKHGNPFEPYSTKTFALPAGAMFAPGWKTSARIMHREKLLNWFTAKSGKKWVSVTGGYKAMKEKRFGPDKVNLQVRGIRGKGMLGSLAVIKKRNDSVVIGFRNAEAAKLALYHEVLGAGKRKVIRQFMGISPAQQKKIADQYSAIIAKIVEDGIELRNFT